MNKVIFSLLLSWLGLSGPLSWARPAWAHRPSPYRAEFTVLSQPNSPKAGYFLAVPLCNLGDADGKNVFVTDAKGRRLNVWAMGPTRNNSVLVVCSGNFENDSRLYAYWGSSQIAPQNKMSFTPGLTVTIRTAVPNGDITSWAASQKMLRASRRLGIIPIKDIELSTNPIDHAKDVECPVLLQVCEEDNLVSMGSALRTAEILGEHAELKRYPIGHFDIYTGEGFERAVGDQIEFFTRHLLAAKTS